MEYTTNTGENIEVKDGEYGLTVVHDENYLQICLLKLKIQTISLL